MRLFAVALFALALTACLPSAQVAPVAAPANPAAIGNAAQATAQAAWSVVTQQAGATMAAQQATASDTTRRAQSTQDAFEAARIAASQTAQAADLDATKATAAYLDAQATSTAAALATADFYANEGKRIQSERVKLEQARLSFGATQAAMLEQNTWRSAATATVTALDEQARSDRYQTNLLYGGGGGCMSLALFVSFMAVTALVRTISHRHIMAELSLQAALGHVPALLAAPATVTDNDGGRIAINNWRTPETLKRKALAWVSRSIAKNGADAAELVGWPGAESVPVRDALEAAGLVRVEPRGGTYVEQGDLAGLLRDVEAMGDDLQ